MTKTKRCRDCEQVLPLDAFHRYWREDRQRHWYPSRCKGCLRAYRHPDAAAGLRTCMDCKESLPLDQFPLAHGSRAKGKGHRKRRCANCWSVYRNGQYMERDRAWRFKSAYKITLEDRDEILAIQGDVCSICKRDTPNAADWCMDHDHKCCPTRSKSCGECLRGVLCHSCNAALGLLGDNPETIQRALQYVRFWDQAAVSRRLPA